MKTTDKIQKHATQVYMTKDYTLFKPRPGNRPVKQSHVDRLARSILEHGWIGSSFIIVGDNMAALDGQHRIEAVKQIKKQTGKEIEVRYVVDRSLNDIRLVQQTNSYRQSWALRDFVYSYAGQGNETFRRLVDYMEEYNFLPTTALVLVTSRVGDRAKAKEGILKVDDWGRAVLYADRLMELKKYYKYATSTSFATAMVYFWRHPEFKHEEFIEKVKLDRTKLFRVSTGPQHKQMIADIYNYRRKNKVKFDLEEE